MSSEGGREERAVGNPAKKWCTLLLDCLCVERRGREYLKAKEVSTVTHVFQRKPVKFVFLFFHFTFHIP
jgi:hypothetical protein